MRIDVSGPGIPFYDVLRAHAEHRIRAAAGRFAIHINRVKVDISVVDHQPGSADKQCRILVGLIGLPSVIEEDLAFDFYEAVNRAAERVSRTLAQKLARRRLG